MSNQKNMIAKLAQEYVRASVQKHGSVFGFVSLVDEELSRIEAAKEALQMSETSWKLWGTNHDGTKFDGKLIVTGEGMFYLTSYDARSRAKELCTGTAATDVPVRLSRALSNVSELSWDKIEQATGKY